MTGRRAAAGMLLLLPACGGGDCWADGPPDSPPLAVGSQTRVEVRVQDGVLGAVDADGGFHVAQPAARTLLPEGTHAFPVRRTVDRVEVQVDGRWLGLEGPIGCD